MKQKKSITSRKLGSQYFWRIANSVLNKNKSAIVPQFNNPMVFSFVSGKPKLCKLKTFQLTLLLMMEVSIYLFFVLELIFQWSF